MPRPDAVRRIKSFSAANGFVYQYYFFEVNRIQLAPALGGGPAGEFTFMISADRQAVFPLRILVKKSALDAWALHNGRALTSSEEYAVSKMRLFQAFDEDSVPAEPQAYPLAQLLVDESNLDTLLHQLDI